MLRLLSRIILFVIIGFSLCIKGYAEDKKYHLDGNYQAPNYNDPTKPNYVSGTRTDMAPKVGYEQNNEKKDNNSKVCKPSQDVVRAYDSRYSRNPIDGVLHPIEVIGATKLWEKECEKQKAESEKHPRNPL